MRITDRRSPAELNIVTDPKPFSRRFQGTIRSLTVLSAIKGHRGNDAAAHLGIFQNTRFASRDSTAIENSSLVTDLVTVDGNGGLEPSRSGRTPLPWLLYHDTPAFPFQLLVQFPA
jgi:hypothetical protein